MATKQTKKSLLQDAIADAKQIKETALANAKAALDEAFGPKIKSMLAAKLAEEMEEDDLDVDMKEGDDSYEDDSEELDEKKKSDSELEDEDVPDDNEIGENQGEPEGKGKGHDSSPDQGEPEDDEKEKGIHEIDLDELFASLDEKKDGSEEDADSDDDEHDSDKEAEDMTEDGDLAKFLEELKNEYNQRNEAKKSKAINAKDKSFPTKFNKKADSETDKENDEEEGVQEVIRQINELKKELNEVNLVNAKLLYLNKILKENSLTESQKLTVVKTFDKANTVREAKLAYMALNEGFKSRPKQKGQLKENFGLASKAAGGSTKKDVITENATNDFRKRMQLLAGITPSKKSN